MNKQIDTKTLGIIGSFFVMILVVGGFFWIWKSAQPAKFSDVTIDQKYQKVEISSLKSEAEDLLSNRQNNGSLPVTVPSADQIGRSNPFVSP